MHFLKPFYLKELCSTTTHAAAVRDVMERSLPNCTSNWNYPKRCVRHDTVAHIANLVDSFEMLTDAQVVALMYMGINTAQTPICSVNNMLHDVNPQLVETTSYLISGDVDLHPIRHL